MKNHKWKDKRKWTDYCDNKKSIAKKEKALEDISEKKINHGDFITHMSDLDGTTAMFDSKLFQDSWMEQSGRSKDPSGSSTVMGCDSVASGDHSVSMGSKAIITSSSGDMVWGTGPSISKGPPGSTIPHGDYWEDESDGVSIKITKVNKVNKQNEKTTITMKRMNEVLDKVYTTPSLRKSIVPLFIGNPGLGKTVIIQEFAKEKKATLVELITSQMSPFEISGIAMPDKEIKKMVYYNFDKLENLKDGDILFFDELLNGNPVVLNACLTILEQRKFISGKDLPDIMIIAAANPQGMAPLTPQIKERFIWYTVGFDKKMWINYMVKKYQITRSIGTKLATLIKEEEFLSNNFNSPRSIDKATNMLIHEVPSPYEDTIKPIISELIQNPFEEPVHLPDGRQLAPAEMISWLDLIKLKYNEK